LNPSVCREHLDKLFAEEAGALARLEELLDKEHEFLLANDVDEFERAGEARQACIAQLVRIEDERRSLCRMMNVSADHLGLEKLFTWCDPSRKLKDRLTACSERAGRCRSLNDRNGALVTARLKRVEGLLGVITGRANQPKMYGRQGTYQNVAPASRLNTSV
jgi:flagellar biosynthesis/type III secretory pathway chaperone